MKMSEFFSNFVNKFKASDSQRDLLSILKPGDMVWATMPLPREELEGIEESHRIRPYLVMWKDFSNIYAYQSSSKKNDELNNYEIYMINKFRYDNKKDSWIDLSNIVKIPVNYLVNKMCSLDEPDFIMIEKRLKIQMNRNKLVKRSLNTKFSFSMGDVISDNSTKYYVFDNKSKICCYVLTKKLKDGDENAKRVKINRKYYYIYFDKEFLFEEDVRMKIIDMAYIGEVMDINRLRKETRKNVKVERKEGYKIGTVFKVKSKKIMYLYSTNGVCYGVDTFMYKAVPKIVSIYMPETKEILEVYDNNRVKDIVKYLAYNMKPVSRKIRKLYEAIS